MESRTKTFLCVLPIIIFFGILYTAGSISMNEKDTSEYKSTSSIPQVKSLTMMSNSELNQIKTDWQYRDLLRNIDGYSGKIIFVDGEVSFSYLNSGELHLCTSTENAKFGIPYTCANEDFVVMGNGVNTWVEKDILQGYVEVTGELDFMSNPKVKEIRLTCSNC